MLEIPDIFWAVSGKLDFFKPTEWAMYIIETVLRTI